MALYGIKITSEKDSAIFQYSFPFHIETPTATNQTATATSAAPTKTDGLSIGESSGPQVSAGTFAGIVVPIMAAIMLVGTVAIRKRRRMRAGVNADTQGYTSLAAQKDLTVRAVRESAHV